MTLGVLAGAIYGFKVLNSNSSQIKNVKEKKKGRGNVDRVFLERTINLIKRLCPKANCREAGYAVLLLALLIVRTMMSIWLSDVNGRVVKAIVNKNLGLFVKRIFILFLFALPSSAVNSSIDYVQKLLALAFRERLSDHFHNQYLRNMHYYKICNLDNRISNPDQQLTKDTEMWANALSLLFINTTKPTLDLILFTRKLK